MPAAKIKRFLPQIVLAVLIVIFFSASPRKEKSFDTALLNPKYSPDKVTLSYSGEGSAVLKKAGDFWVCEYHAPDGQSAVFPCDNAVLKNLLDYFHGIIKVYEVSDSLKSAQSLSLSEDDAFCIEFSQGEKTLSKLFFGAVDSRRRIAFYAEGRAKIYCTDSRIVSYLTALPDFWCDPLIFPQSVCGSLDGAVYVNAVRPEDMPSLRHGKFFLGTAPDFSASDFVEADDGRGNVYRVQFVYANDLEENYYCRFSAVPSVIRSESEKSAMESFDYVTTISTWTYNKIFGK